MLALVLRLVSRALWSGYVYGSFRVRVIVRVNAGLGLEW